MKPKLFSHDAPFNGKFNSKPSLWEKRWIYFWDMTFLWCKYSTWPSLTAYQMSEYLAINPYQASARKLHSGGGIK